MSKKTLINGWTTRQQRRLQECIDAGHTIAYWNSDQHGRPCNGGRCADGWRARVGLVQRIDAEVAAPCGPGALHATHEPHRWSGCRVWVVALSGSVVVHTGKLGATVREFLGEVLPEHAWAASVGVRVGRKDLYGADLRSANLRGAGLSGANLRGANLSGAALSVANLSVADLYGADLSGADLRSANLCCANLRGANLRGADLGANLSGANLRGADLYGANLYGANLYGADLYSANLSGADLRGADLGNYERGPDGFARLKTSPP